MLENKLTVTESPHMKKREKVSDIMYHVFIALCPAAAAGVYFFGPRALIMMVLSVLSCMGFEALWQKLTHRRITVSDGSAAVTGLLLAFNVPVTLPYPMVIIGALFAIIIVKQLFGGLGQNFVNPALAARAFLLASWPVQMTTWAAPLHQIALFHPVDAVTCATPLAILKGTASSGTLPSVLDMFIGNTGGCIGETSALLLLVGAAYLMIKKIIKPHMPLAFIGTVAVLTFLFGQPGTVLASLLSGGLMLGAFFMATDYTTSPITGRGQMIGGMICGALTVLIRIKGGYPEGVSYSILLMNVLTPLIDKWVRPRRFGEVSAWQKLRSKISRAS